MLQVISPPADSRDLSVARQSRSSPLDATKAAKRDKDRHRLLFNFHFTLLIVKCVILTFIWSTSTGSCGF